MRTVSFKIKDDEFRELQAIASRFYKGCFHGPRPMDIRELAMYALLDKRKDMAWVLKPEVKARPLNVVPGPWQPRLCKARKTGRAKA